MFRLAVCVSGGGSNLQAIMDRINDGSLPNIVVEHVIASKENTLAEERAKKASISCQVIKRSNYSNLQSYDEAMLAALATKGIDLVVLAGFMNLLGPGFVSHYRNRIINIHPSLIPAFCGHGLYGIKPHQAALAYGVKLSGATVHFVDEQYDTGPIILQKAVEVLPQDTAASLQLRVMKEAEHVILPQAIALIASGKIEITGRQTKIVSD